MSATQNKQVSITDLERAINYWRQQHPSSRDTMTLCPQAASLAEVYAKMILLQENHVDASEFTAKATQAFQEAETAFENASHKAA